MPKSIFYGHACLKQSSSDATAVLMDPWFSRSGAFFGSWFQFPENTPFLDEALEGVTDICVSHNHADHFDPSFLRYAFASNPSIQLHIPKYVTQWFLRRVHHFFAGIPRPGYSACALRTVFSRDGHIVLFRPRRFTL